MSYACICTLSAIWLFFSSKCLLIYSYLCPFSKDTISFYWHLPSSVWQVAWHMIYQGNRYAYVCVSVNSCLHNILNIYMYLSYAKLNENCCWDWILSLDLLSSLVIRILKENNVMLFKGNFPWHLLKGHWTMWQAMLKFIFYNLALVNFIKLF